MKPILVFDETVGSTAVLSSPEFNKFLGAFDKYSFHMVCSAASGTLGTVTATLYHSSDERNFLAKTGATMTTATLSATAPTSKIGSDPGTDVSQGFGQLQVSASSAMQTRVKIYATGRKA